MKKKLIALFAACSMIATASVGLVQTVYADGVSVRIDVTDGATDEQKVLNFYYEGVNGLASLMANLTFSGGAVTIDSYDITVPIDDGTANKTDGSIWLSNANDSTHGASSDDGKFATATVTVPTDVDITVSFAVTEFYDGDYWDDYTAEVGTVTATIPKKAAPEPEVEVTKTVEDSAAFTVAEGYDNDMVVGKVTVTIKGSYDLKNATYNQQTGTVTDAEGNAVDNTVITGGAAGTDVLVFVVINGATDVAELNNVVFE